MMFLKLAFRNLLRNKERTLLSLLMVLSSTAGLVLFRAYTDDTIDDLETISTEMHFGHLQVARNEYWQNSYHSIDQRLITDFPKMKEVSSKFSDRVRLVSGRLHAFGLLSAGVKTENASFMGYEVDQELGVKDTLSFPEGTYFDPTSFDDQIIVGHLLAKKLGIKPGDTITVLGNTIDGVINAKDFVYKGSFASGSEEIDKYYAYVSLRGLQDLLQTSAVDLVTIRLKDKGNLQSAKKELQAQVDKNFKNHSVRDWTELAEFFRKVKEFYDMQNFIIRFILISIVVLGILNTVGMSIFERIGEIGTMRSLGAEPPFIYTLFFFEILMLSCIGVALGGVTAYFVGSAINSADIYTEVPGASMPMKVAFLFSKEAFLDSGLIIIFTTVLVSFVPMFRALRLSVVDSLRRNL